MYFSCYKTVNSACSKKIEDVEKPAGESGRPERFQTAFEDG